MKQGFFSNQEFRKYLLYALGEMALVIIGILIALQIDNWNTARKDRETLDSYLQSIARNISSDLVAAEQVRTRREDAFQSSSREWALVGPNSYSSVEAVAFAYGALDQARALSALHTNDSAYDALKSSGNLDQLQGTAMEALLYDYYGTINRIDRAEQNRNEYARELWLRILSDWPEGVEEWELSHPSVLTVHRFRELEPAYRRLLGGTHAQALYVHAISSGPLLLEYERLERLGTAIAHMVDSGLMDLDEEATSILDSIYDPGVGIGFPALIDKGRVAWHSYGLLATDSNVSSVSYTASEETIGSSGPRGLNFNSVQWLDDRMRIDYPGGALWAGVWIISGEAAAARTGMDYSSFDTLSLELRSDTVTRQSSLNSRTETTSRTELRQGSRFRSLISGRPTK